MNKREKKSENKWQKNAHKKNKQKKWEKKDKRHIYKKKHCHNIRDVCVCIVLEDVHVINENGMTLKCTMLNWL